MIKALVFDMDGVIIDSEPIQCEIAVAVMRSFGAEPSPSELYEFIGVTNQTMWPILKERHNIKASVEELLERQQEYKKKRFFQEPIEAIDGIGDLVKTAVAKGLKIALATSSPRYFAEHILKTTGLMPYFDVMVTADDITRSKPDPEIYLKAAQHLGIEPAACVAIEDAELGIQSAKSAGMRVIAFKNPNSGRQDTSKADFVVTSIRDIDLDKLDI
ncbi:MAG TPA: HAD family phosphatase [Thermoclostridium caenicola]|uniref:Haloacid dehalogenase superfamily, subfamily IA, variant 3 with third motif having DD or ED/haloacid dehalogenase superfamily, subfamily IA, variant 1 with third motif having Dx(3-4)D or Dx(3-4)E n=1 Tax=Thermoclostridium caenicola TaxID=659425 RepID=A0A1M6C8R3_9FIRM|nr:HAD family phosphatase [Thermoclostridium caenicola]SHI57181.1 haloacid dehalogenase superfamily, subfamily IA, variant 3 with third motif having DD or ED/haloacid dehalogenase superfamily, subfamily IA, variant 1 with third motif having Dx(3-4)D or Dx(3-4)E [Thermoclostridium caenicola]HOK43335.1 HAD family phosphatase [Thermoclostridium caenicola]HOL85052.1 HAD family phosphatase [Thermoclostridium caenicola]HOP71684.1 HAD family phosphatase [Thermoclostridium caenicola]HPO77211.1 HAD fam